jgi:hypothetical protein
VSLAFEVAIDALPSASFMPGPMHQNEHCHGHFSQEWFDAKVKVFRNSGEAQPAADRFRA